MGKTKATLLNIEIAKIKAETRDRLLDFIHAGERFQRAWLQVGNLGVEDFESDYPFGDKYFPDVLDDLRKWHNAEAGKDYYIYDTDDEE